MIKGLSLKTAKKGKQLQVVLKPEEVVPKLLDAESIIREIGYSSYAEYYLFESQISVFIDRIKTGEQAVDASKNYVCIAGEVRDSEITIELSEDKMEASLTVTKPYAGRLPTMESILELIDQYSVKKGISKKRIERLLQEVAEGKVPGKAHKMVIAKGLPARNGKDSRIKSLAPSPFELILKPATREDGTADMRDLGGIFTVDENQEVAKRVPPTNGRHGYDVTGNQIKALPGELKPIKLGENTVISPNDENLIIATCPGVPKFKNNVQHVSDVTVTKGVNIATGNLQIKGAILVNGDVTESMEVEATGDITINGFVESATVRAGGDIVITEGATGKVHVEDCRLFAEGNIFIQHGQGMTIVCGGNIQAINQLAYSKITCNGAITVGKPEKPMGNLFACEITCEGRIVAGTIGAKSGSSLSVDFSPGYNLLDKNREGVRGLRKKLREKITEHKTQLNHLEDLKLPEHLKERLSKANQIFEYESYLLQWLDDQMDELEDIKQDYERNIGIVANEVLFQNVVLKLNNQIWRAQREYQASKLWLMSGKWEYDPL